MSEAVKIALAGPDGEVETLWANPTESGFYVLDNAPWYALRVSLGDTIEATPDPSGFLEMVRVVAKSGNRTIRVILEITDHVSDWTYESQKLVAALQALDCSVEGMNKKLIAVTVPAQVDLFKLGEYVDSAGFEFEYADPTYEDLFPAAADPA